MTWQFPEPPKPFFSRHPWVRYVLAVLIVLALGVWAQAVETDQDRANAEAIMANMG